MFFKHLRLLCIASLLVNLSACGVTEVVTTPLRAVGTIVSYMPVVGDTSALVIDSSANIIDAMGVIVHSGDAIIDAATP